jgi:hypothetical protein
MGAICDNGQPNMQRRAGPITFGVSGSPQKKLPALKKTARPGNKVLPVFSGSTSDGEEFLACAAEAPERPNKVEVSSYESHVSVKRNSPSTASGFTY